jgi:ubiquinone/menaquinone biosynthesis C-methylase UbiE
MMLFDSLQRRFRARRMALLARTVGLTRDLRVLDVGGTVEIWRLAPVMPRLVLLNQARARYEIGAGEAIVLGDGGNLPFADQSFDLVFSNSVIEHVGSRPEQVRFAAEIARVGKQYWVQTPNRYFPIEQHLWTPFVHWLPRPWQAVILRRFSVWKMVTDYDAEQREFYVNHYLDSIRLLAASDLRALFPGATVKRERFFGWTKSLIAWLAKGKPGVP